MGLSGSRASRSLIYRRALGERRPATSSCSAGHPLSPPNEAERDINPQISVYKLVLWPEFRRLFFLCQPPSCCCCPLTPPPPPPPLAPLAQPPLPLPLLLISHLKSESVAVLTAQKEAVMCINPCIGSGCDKAPEAQHPSEKIKGFH